MEWRKKIGQKAGEDGGWRDDFPLSHELPGCLDVDCAELRLPMHPMFAVRLRVFLEWHRKEGRQVEVTPPADAAACSVFHEMGATPSTRRRPSSTAAQSCRLHTSLATLRSRTSHAGPARFLSTNSPTFPHSIGDPGIGIPEHIRQRYPEWSDDGYAMPMQRSPT